MSWIYGLVMAGGKAVGELQKNDQSMQAAESYGVKIAGIDYSAGKQQALIPNQIGTVEDNKVNALLNVEMNQMQAEADAVNSAAAAGTTGASVDMTIADTEDNAARAASRITEVADQQVAQLEQDFIDIGMNAELAKGNIDTTMSRGGLLNIGAGFLQGYSLGV